MPRAGTPASAEPTGRLQAIKRAVMLRARPFGLATAMTVAGLIIGSFPGVLLVLFAIMIALDAIVPLPGRTWSEADARFFRLVRQRRRRRRLRGLRGLGPDRLPILDDPWISRAERHGRGVQTIPLDSVTGTVEESKSAAFDAAFRPERASAEHWKRVWMANARGIPMAPISVYRVGDEHVVIDGHHRVSVARDLGDTVIDADVTELTPPRGETRGTKSGAGRASAP